MYKYINKIETKTIEEVHIAMICENVYFTLYSESETMGFPGPTPAPTADSFFSGSGAETIFMLYIL
jgi:hypothetical protein